MGCITTELLPSDMISETIRLSDGRRLGVLQTGDLQGRLVFFFHDLGMSRLSGHPNQGIARHSGVRLIAVDRPGIGLSDPKPERSLLDWPKDVAEIADWLGLERFAVLGCSAGGAYALACAALMPKRVVVIGLASSAVPLTGKQNCKLASFNRPELPKGWRHLPWLMRIYLHQTSRHLRSDPHAVMAHYLANMVPSDREIASQQLFYQNLLMNKIEAYSQGGYGVIQDLEILTRPWEFDLTTIQTLMHLWHGQLDTNWPVKGGRWLGDILPGCRTTSFPKEGNLLYLNRWAEILEALAQYE